MNTERWIFKLIVVFVLTACSSGTSNDERGSTDDTASESGIVPDTSDLGTDSGSGTDSDSVDGDNDAGDDTDTAVSYDYEMIQSLEEALDPLTEMIVYDKILYFTFASGFVLCRVDVDGAQDFECMGEAVRALTSYNGHVWWYSLGNVASYTPETEEITYLSLGDYSDLSFDFTLDNDGLFFADHGCKNVLGMSYEGDVTLFENLVYDGRANYFPYVATGPGYVYCSGSSGKDYTAGKLYGVPKAGGDIVEITSAPTTNETNYQHTTGPMKIVDDTLYYFHFYTGGSDGEPLWLLSVPTEGGESTVLFVGDRYIYESPLVYDKLEHALYFTVWEVKQLYKYEISNKKIKSIPIEYYPHGQLAVDDTYIYWYMNKSIYRMMKF